MNTPEITFTICGDVPGHDQRIVINESGSMVHETGTLFPERKGIDLSILSDWQRKVLAQAVAAIKVKA